MSGMKYQWRVACATILCIAAVALISQVSDGNVALAPVDVDRLPLNGVKGTRQLQAQASSSVAAEKGQGNQSSDPQSSAGALATGLSSSAALASGIAAKKPTNVVPTIYVITPTYYRLVQKAELTRLCHTFRLVPKIHWIVVEDSENKTDLVARLLGRCGVAYTHLNAATPEKYRLSKFKSRHQVPRGVAQRNAGLDWLQKKFTNGTKIVPEAQGVVYFGDDDNTYDLQLFEEMRDTKRVSAWPVAFVGGILVEKPILGPDGRIKKWNSVHKPERPYPMDMAGFAINLRLLLRHPGARFSYKSKLGYQESIILGRVGVPIQEFEVKADEATKIYVWHTRSEAPVVKWEDTLKIRSNNGMEV